MALAAHCAVPESRVIAFSPRTSYTPAFRLSTQGFWDTPWDAWARTALSPSAIWDVRRMLLEHSPVSVDLFVDMTEPLEVAHTERILHIPGVTLHRYEEGGHQLVKLLRDRGELPNIMRGTW